MKKIISFFVVCAIAACNSGSHQVPTNISEAFAKMHPNAKIDKWNDEPPIWEAKYQDDTEKGAVSFDSLANVTETELVIDQHQLPDSNVIPKYISEHYPNEKLQHCEKVTTASGVVTYEIQITGQEIVFDSTANFLKEEKD